MPPQATRLEAHYTYDAAGDANCIDIGIFDTRGIAFLDAGFRGWSGSARQAVFITSQTATPGYLPGPLQPGTWRIALGCYKIVPEGCHVRVVVRCTINSAQQPDQPLMSHNDAACTPILRDDGWYRGELHCHTHHSDGDSSAHAVLDAAQALGLDFLAITDHNTISAQVELATAAPGAVLLIPGCEITTFRGHWNVWGLREWVDFRGSDADAQERAMRWASARGGLISCNHPKPYGPPWAYARLEAYQCVEVWNGPWPYLNAEALRFWDAQLQRGRQVTAVGGSDMHRLHPRGPLDPARLGQPTTWLHCREPLSVTSALDALRAGRVFISATPAGPQLRLYADGDRSGSFQTMMGDQVAVAPDEPLAIRMDIRGGQGMRVEMWHAQGCAYRGSVDTEHARDELRIDPAGSPYIRAQLTDATGKLVYALSNPIYLVSSHAAGASPQAGVQMGSV
jgi:hypothetical protein